MSRHTASLGIGSSSESSRKSTNRTAVLDVDVDDGWDWCAFFDGTKACVVRAKERVVIAVAAAIIVGVNFIVEKFYVSVLGIQSLGNS